jgi:hypothetical protein
MRFKVSKNKFISIVLISFFVFGLFSFNTFETTKAYTGTITYDTVSDTIYCVGGTSGTPITFEDIYQADLTGLWGNVEKLSPFQYSIEAKLIFGNSDTYTFFKDLDKQVQFLFNSSWSYGYSFITVGENCTFQIGQILNENIKTTERGCNFNVYSQNGWNPTFYVNTNDTSDVFLYSSSFKIFRYDIPTVTANQIVFLGCIDRIWNSKIFYGVINTEYRDVQIDIYNVEAIKGRGDGLIRASNQSLTINKLSLINTFNILRSDMRNTVLKNVYARNITYVISNSNTPLGNVTFIDPDIDNWVFNWQIPYDNQGYCFRQYTFNLNVLNGNITDFVEDATVQLWKDSVLVYEGITNSSGMIPTQTLTYGYYHQSTGNTIQNATSPYYLVISHPDWQTYVSRFYITEPLRLTVSMQEPTVTGYTEKEKSDYTTIILFVISLILCIMGLALTVPLLPLISLTISVLNIIFLSEPTIFNILLTVLNVTFTVIALVRAKTKNN